jgi:hypothetical protein
MKAPTKGSADAPATPLSRLRRDGERSLLVMLSILQVVESSRVFRLWRATGGSGPAAPGLARMRSLQQTKMSVR